MFVIRRDDGAYVAPLGSARSYTKHVEHARVFRTRESAERERCPGNESIVSVSDVLQRPE